MFILLVKVVNHLGNIQYSKALEKQRDWAAKSGGEKCKHSNGFSKEYYLGTQTGDVVCDTCGESFASREDAKINAESN